MIMPTLFIAVLVTGAEKQKQLKCASANAHWRDNYTAIVLQHGETPEDTMLSESSQTHESPCVQFYFHETPRVGKSIKNKGD